MSDFYLIYVDGYGDSSKKLNDPKQIIFSLTATFVKSEYWTSLENELLEILIKVKTDFKLSKIERLHAVDIYQRSKGYRAIEFDECMSLFEEVLSVIKSHQVRYMSFTKDKREMRATALKIGIRNREALKIGESVSQELQKYYNGEEDFLPTYAYAFADMICDVDSKLNELNAYGMLIIDQQDEFQHYSSLEIYKFLRSSGAISRTVENPLYLDSRTQTLLCIPDFLGYVVGGVKRDELSGKDRPNLRKWFSEFVEPCHFPEIDKSGEFFKSKQLVTTFSFITTHMLGKREVMSRELFEAARKTRLELSRLQNTSEAES